MTRDETVRELDDFANQHGLKLQVRGEVGFGRSCVGLLDRRDHYIDVNPRRAPNYDYVWEVDDRLYAPNGVNAYHKHSCMAVLCGDDEEEYTRALGQLLTWVRHLKSSGDVYVQEFHTGAAGLQVMTSGTVGYALRLR